MIRHPRITAPILGELRQGTIFSCARAEFYDECLVHGIVITARCDLTNDKVSVVNYLPIVSVDDWLRRDFRLILCDRAKRDAESALRDILKNSDHGAFILQIESLERIRDALFPSNSPDRKARAARESISKQIHRLEVITELERGYADAAFRVVVQENEKIGQQILKECMLFRLSGYYFLPSVDPGGDDIGFVVLLREIKAIPTMLARAVASGIDSSTAQADFSAQLLEHLDFSRVDFAMPVGVLRSPEIEHLLQTFANLFGRIGVEDFEPRYVSGLWERQPCISALRGVSQ